MIFFTRLFAAVMFGRVSTALAMPALNSRASPDLICGGDRLSISSLPSANETLLAHGPDPSLTGTEVKVHWNVIHADETFNGGYLTSDQVDAAINALNEHFAVSGISFERVNLQYTNNSDWFANASIGDTELDNPQAAAMKDQLHTGIAQDLNIYSVGFKTSNLGGYATFPWWYKDSPKRDGVLFKWNTIPGDQSLPNYSQGKILVHEVGHWTGLYHTFQGGCSDTEGDYVSDTPAEAAATFGCPANPTDTCPDLPGFDPIHNHMDYTYDACKTDTFTPGQVSRMQAAMQEFRSE